MVPERLTEGTQTLTRPADGPGGANRAHFGRIQLASASARNLECGNAPKGRLKKDYA